MIIKCKDCYNLDRESKTCNWAETSDVVMITTDKEIACIHGIICDPNVRWEKGMQHGTASKRLYESIAQIDYDNGDTHCFKKGGDSDNGEALMYLLDIHFEVEAQ